MNNVTNGSYQKYYENGTDDNNHNEKNEMVRVFSVSGEVFKEIKEVKP